MMQLTVSTLAQACVAKAADKYNATLPDGATPLTLEQYLEQVVIGSYVRQYARLPGQTFLLRLTGAEMDAIRALAASGDAMAGAAVERLHDSEPLNLASPTFGAIVAHLVQTGALSADRIPALSALE